MNTSIETNVFDTWKGKTVAFIGDSITDGIGTTRTYHDMLANVVGFSALNYGKNGAQVSDMIGFAEGLYHEHPETDAIFVFGGTNDYNDGVILGSPFSEVVENVNHDGMVAPTKKRVVNMNCMTFHGRMNTLLHKLRTYFPKAQIILLAPIHRGYATFGSDNVQPCEYYANARGSYIDDYVDAVKRCGAIWSAPVIDLYAESALMPVLDEHTPYFNNAETDRLHPNCLGHARIAQLIAGYMHIYACL